jgi:hypothetical protein
MIHVITFPFKMAICEVYSPFFRHTHINLSVSFIPRTHAEVESIFAGDFLVAFQFYRSPKLPVTSKHPYVSSQNWPVNMPKLQATHVLSRCYGFLWSVAL